MAINYAALIAEWPSLTGTTAQKLATLNAMTVTGSIPTLFQTTGAAIWAGVDGTEFMALSADNASRVQNICLMPSLPSGSSSNLAHIFPAIFSPTGPTITALAALAQATVLPWWEANGFGGPIDMNDLAAAGGLT